MTTSLGTSRLPTTPTKSVRDRIANFEASSSPSSPSIPPSPQRQQPPKSPSSPSSPFPSSPISGRRTSILGRSNLPRPSGTSLNLEKSRRVSISASKATPAIVASSSLIHKSASSVTSTSAVTAGSSTSTSTSFSENSSLLMNEKLDNVSTISPSSSTSGLATNLEPLEPEHPSDTSLSETEEAIQLPASISYSTTQAQVRPELLTPNLDDLLSPQLTTSTPALFSNTSDQLRPSDEGEDEDEGKGEETNSVRFSMVPLSGKSFDQEGKIQVSISASSSDFGHGNGDGTGEPLDYLAIENLPRPIVTLGEQGSGNVLSPTTLTFLKNRLEKQEKEHDDAHGHDLSLGTNEQFQAQLTQLQIQEKVSEAEAERIDWSETIYFWGAVMAGQLYQSFDMSIIYLIDPLPVDYHQFARDNSEELARAIESGIPNSLRGMLWQLMSASKDPDLETEYARYLKESSVHEKAIARDLGRTFPHHDFFRDGKGIGQENLFNVLKAYSLYDPEVGYCQGLPFIVAVLLLNMPDEEAFCLLVRLMMTYGLRGHFLPEMPALQLRLFQFDRLFPLDVVFRIYDNVLATGIEAIFGFAVALLKRSEEQLLKLKFDDILDYLRNKLFEAYRVENNDDEELHLYLVDQFVRDASLIPITPFMLDAYAHEYEDSVREREAHAIEMDNLRNVNRSLSNQIKMLEANLAQLNTEHCEAVKQLVMVRLDNETLESELVSKSTVHAYADSPLAIFIMPDEDTFLPHIESVFYAIFHEKRGPQILYQVPEGLITQGSGSTTFPSLTLPGPIRSPVSGPQPTSRTFETSITGGSTKSLSSVYAAANIDNSTGLAKFRDSPSPVQQINNSSSSNAAFDSSAPPSPASYRSPHQKHTNANTKIGHVSAIVSPQNVSQRTGNIVITPLFDFSDVSRFVIPAQDMCGRLVICSTQRHRVIGFPICLEADKYERVHFRYNLCFVFDRDADLSCYEPIVRKIARVLMACEEESSFLSDQKNLPHINSILEQLYEDLNSYHETSIIIDKFNSFELKLFPFYSNPPPVYDWTVPLALINIVKRMKPNWDITMTRICKYIDGINHVSRIAYLADCDLELTRQAVSHLLYYQCIMTIDIFQYSNMYTLDRPLQWLADDPTVKEECGPYVTKPGYVIPSWSQLLYLYSHLNNGITVLSWEEEHNVRPLGIDVRRFITFGVIKGFLRRVHRWPVLMPEKPRDTMKIEVSPQDTKPVGGRRRGKSFTLVGSTSKPDRPRSPEVKRERAHSQSQAQPGTTVRPLLTRQLTEAEEYARSVREKGESIQRRHSRRPSGISESRPLASDFTQPFTQPLKRHSSEVQTPSISLVNHTSTFKTIEARRASQIRSSYVYRISPSPEMAPGTVGSTVQGPNYPGDLPRFLDGMHHTDELATHFEAGWPTIERWITALGGGQGNGDYGRVVIIHR
ncbi:hypothetical protein Clacol_000272 [Clathrus columnatus]|uniref:Rab-GAP TBC domain-containing protein n=1 Tax=Clathrus columnatus TaxID=1419009 RepID=A0AAV4ZYW4_9AGAM|nr:hypothetical protein Clacol_000272 [Clathrus columnatus]